MDLRGMPQPIAAGAPGLLPVRLTEAEAILLAERLSATGLHAQSICSMDVPQLHAAEDVHHVRCKPEGLEIVELHDATERIIPWRSIEMLAIGLSAQLGRIVPRRQIVGTGHPLDLVEHGDAVVTEAAQSLQGKGLLGIGLLDRFQER